MLLNKQTNKQILTLVRRDFVLKVYCSGGRRTIVMGFLDGSDGKESAAIQETPWVGKIPLEKGMAPHSSIHAWRIPWTEEPGQLSIVHGAAELDTTAGRTQVPLHETNRP